MQTGALVQPSLTWSVITLVISGESFDSGVYVVSAAIAEPTPIPSVIAATPAAAIPIKTFLPIFPLSVLRNVRTYYGIPARGGFGLPTASRFVCHRDGYCLSFKHS